MKKLFTVGVLSFVLSGCLSPPSSQEMRSASYGELPVNYQEIVKSYSDGLLKDPYSAKYMMAEPCKAWLREGLLTSSGGKPMYGWLIPYKVNAKNSYGGYTGYENHVAFYINGRVANVDGLVNNGQAGCSK